MLWLVALLFAAPQNVMNAGGGNALTLPAAAAGLEAKAVKRTASTAGNR